MNPDKFKRTLESSISDYLVDSRHPLKGRVNIFDEKYLVLNDSLKSMSGSWQVVDTPLCGSFEAKVTSDFRFFFYHSFHYVLSIMYDKNKHTRIY